MKKIKQLIAVLVVALCLVTTVSDTCLPVSVYAASTTETTEKINVKKLKIKLSKTTFTYNGKEQKPKVTVTYKGKKVKSENYTVKYSSGRKLPGTYKVTVTLKGKYTGKKTLKYKIELKAPTVKVSKTTDTAITLKWAKTAKSKGYVIYNSKKKKIASTKKTSYTVKNLTSGKKYTFYVRSYSKVGKKTYYSAYAKVSSATSPIIIGAKTLYIGDTYTYKVKTNSKVSWSVDDEEIAEITSKGKLTVYDEGIVRIKAKANGVSSYFDVTLKTPTIELNNSYISINEGNSAKLVTTITPANMKIEWETDNSSVAAVSSDGLITANSPGTATIKATGYYQNYTYEDYCVVTVVEVPTTVPSTTAPTTQPTTIPTTTPTTAPSTTAPTEPSTTVPTTVPTTQPTTIPTTNPTTVPSTTPTEPSTTIPTTQPTMAPTEPPVEESAFEFLKNEICSYGFVNSDGLKFVSRESTTGNYTFKTGIIYDHYKDALIFMFTGEGTGETSSWIDKTIYFTIYPESTHTTVVYTIDHYIDYELAGSGTASAYLDIADYTANTQLNFHWEPYSSNYIVDSTDFYNDPSLESLFSRSDMLLRNTYGISLYDLGFISY